MTNTTICFLVGIMVGIMIYVVVRNLTQYIINKKITRVIARWKQ